MRLNGGFEVRQRYLLSRERSRLRDLLDQVRAASMRRSEFETCDISDDAAIQAHGIEDRLVAIEQALDRIDADRYGLCERCGSAIPIRRLQALPATAVCPGCIERQPVAGSAMRPAML